MSGNNIEVLVDNEPVPALVDSGVSFSIISEKYRRLLKKVLFPTTNNVLLKVADGNYMRPVGKMYASSRNQWPTSSFRIFVLPQCSHDIILGWDFWGTSKAVIDSSSSELLFQDVIEKFQTLAVYSRWKTIQCLLVLSERLMSWA
ncbi:hypothetical protein HNY73_011096 [Argiope bruennichi]|uniref:Uncharacterized protein n=1 Tax=Argiope bruennichi TaxID=94029 RepID=A0A8T0F5I6_ARGBR|nr:hypothetical protein HNY73_011096 [Argiope bruennichi]